MLNEGDRSGLSEGKEKALKIFIEGEKQVRLLLRRGGVITNKGRLVSTDIVRVLEADYIEVVKKEKIVERDRDDLPANLRRRLLTHTGQFDLIYFVMPDFDKEIAFRRSKDNPTELHPCCFESGLITGKFERVMNSFGNYFLRLYDKDEIESDDRFIFPKYHVRTIMLDLAQTVGKGDIEGKLH